MHKFSTLTILLLKFYNYCYNWRKTEYKVSSTFLVLLWCKFQLWTDPQPLNQDEIVPYYQVYHRHKYPPNESTSSQIPVLRKIHNTVVNTITYNLIYDVLLKRGCFYHTWILRVLPAALGFALVKASGSLHNLLTSRTKPWSGTLIPTSIVPGFNSGFKFNVLSNTTVTGPGKSSFKRALLIVTCPHLQWKILI